jgi:predicted permease
VRGSVVTQIALSTLLLVCAGLVLRSFSKAQRFDPGFDREHVLLGSFDLFPTGYGPNDTFEFDRELLAKIRVLPGVQSVTLSNWVPLGPMASFREINPEGYVSARQESMVIGAAIVGPDYLRTMRIPLMAGREFQLSDTSQSELVVVVNEALADRYWPHQDALGKRLQVERKKWYKVIGVAHNSSYRELDEAPVPFMYLSVLQNYFPQQTIHARVAGAPERLAVELNATVHELNPDLPLFDISTLKLRVQFANVTRRIAGIFVAILGLLALVLAAIGIYGVVAYTTRQRTREIGIRVALGARRTNILRMVLTEGLKLALAGLGIGVAVSLPLTHMLSGLLFGISPNDLATFISVIVFLLVIALGACYIPAVYASHVDPMRILREQ